MLTTNEPNTLTRADIVRRSYLTAAGNLQQGKSADEYCSRYTAALEQDHQQGVDPTLRAPAATA